MGTGSAADFLAEFLAKFIVDLVQGFMPTGSGS